MAESLSQGVYLRSVAGRVGFSRDLGATRSLTQGDEPGHSRTVANRSQQGAWQISEPRV